jgi:hypothetical protein
MPTLLARTSRSPDQSPDQRGPREHGVLKPNAFGLPHTEARSPARTTSRGRAAHERSAAARWPTRCPNSSSRYSLFSNSCLN